MNECVILIWYIKRNTFTFLCSEPVLNGKYLGTDIIFFIKDSLVL